MYLVSFHHCISGMIYHKRTEHFEEKPFACEDCGAKFGANSSLKNHMRLHTGEKPYRCKHCDMSFSVAAALAYHTKKKHSEGKAHTHILKNRIFALSHHDLRNLFSVIPLHVLSVQSVKIYFVFLCLGKMYVCQYCKAVFAQSIELTRHVRTHTGDRPYVCRECGKGYSQASGLTVHLHTFHSKNTHTILSGASYGKKCFMSASFTVASIRKDEKKCSTLIVSLNSQLSVFLCCNRSTFAESACA